ncbi:hypothetical protein D3C78_716300 [compost metagenome]
MQGDLHAVTHAHADDVGPCRGRIAVELANREVGTVVGVVGHVAEHVGKELAHALVPLEAGQTDFAQIEGDVLGEQAEHAVEIAQRVDGEQIAMKQVLQGLTVFDEAHTFFKAGH